MAKKPPATSEATPKNWNHLVGYEDSLTILQRIVRKENLPHVMLFFGRQSIGKESFALAVAALHLCETSSACGRCSACQWLIKGTHPEVIHICGEDEIIKIEHVARLQEHLSLQPDSRTAGPAVRLALITDVDQMTRQATNRMLKTLEEPEPYARIIMTTSRPKALLPTLLSRAVKWHLPPPQESDILDWLRNHHQESIQHKSPEQLCSLIRQAGYAPGEVLSLLGDPTQSDEDQLLRIFQMKNEQQILAALKDATSQKQDLRQVLNRVERSLNGYYRQNMSDLAREYDQVSQRRQWLHKLRRYCRGQALPLNQGLVVERLFFPE